MRSHGTANTYKNGCRCVDCKSAWAAYQRQWRKAKTAHQSDVLSALGPITKVPFSEDHARSAAAGGVA